MIETISGWISGWSTFINGVTGGNDMLAAAITVSFGGLEADEIAEAELEFLREFYSQHGALVGK